MKKQLILFVLMCTLFIYTRGDILVEYKCGAQPGNVCYSLLKTTKKCEDFKFTDQVTSCSNLGIDIPPPPPIPPIEIFRNDLFSVHIDREKSYQIIVTNLKRQIIKTYNLSDTIYTKRRVCNKRKPVR